MTGEDAYDWLMEARAGSDKDAFDAHILASIIALAIADREETGSPLSDGTGLGPSDIAPLAADYFPGAAEALEAMAFGAEPLVNIEEQSLRDILLMYASGASDLERPLAAMVARRCQWPNHLWQDLGLNDRGELSELMTRHFHRLAERNSSDMKWKRFFYRMICRSEGFSLCTAPVCTECNDFENCFGTEDGEARLARARNNKDLVS